jgi:hypothetical protein
MEEVSSIVDNEKYLIKKEENIKTQIDKADKLARVNNKIQILIRSLSTSDERRKMLEEAPLKIQERKDTKEIGYTINKGEKIGLCLDDDENTLFFVVLHELSHVITKEYGHTDKFWKNFEFMIKQAVKLGVYDYKDYNKNPINYCNYKISYTPHKK